MIRLGIVGLGRMGLSHLSIVNTHPEVEVVGLCDAAGYILEAMSKYTGLPTYGDYRSLIQGAKPDGVIVATPSKTHGEISRFALERGLHVFVEKPFCLSVEEGRELVELGHRVGKVTQVGYHYRFVGSFQEAKRLLSHGVIGKVHSFRVDAHGPVVLQPKGGGWRSLRGEGGGCLYDYASHAVNLVNYFLGAPVGVGGTILNSVFSKGVDDEAYSTLYYPNDVRGQMCTNWSDDSHRKMSMRLEVWGDNGKIDADRQDCQVYVRKSRFPELGVQEGWNIRYITDLTQPVRYYVRGEEYSAQMDYFVDCITEERTENINSFASALETDVALDLLLRDAALGPTTTSTVARPVKPGWRETLIRWFGGNPHPGRDPL